MHRVRYTIRSEAVIEHTRHLPLKGQRQEMWNLLVLKTQIGLLDPLKPTPNSFTWYLLYTLGEVHPGDDFPRHKKVS